MPFRIYRIDGQVIMGCESGMEAMVSPSGVLMVE
jgi:hypothetical protein